MSDTVQRMQERLELFLNELAADQTVIQVFLQYLLVLMIAEKGPSLLGDAKKQVLGALGRQTLGGDDVQGQLRKRQLTLIRAEQLFQEIETAIGAVEKSAGGRAPN